MNKLKKKLSNSPATNKNSVALKAFFGITRKWQLSTEQERILLGTTKPTFYRWKNKKNANLNQDTLERISYILGIYKDLRILLSNEDAANNWIHKPNAYPLFNGKSALEKLMLGRVVDLADVRRYLEAQRGW